MRPRIATPCTVSHAMIRDSRNWMNPTSSSSGRGKALDCAIFTDGKLSLSRGSHGQNESRVFGDPSRRSPACRQSSLRAHSVVELVPQPPTLVGSSAADYGIIVANDFMNSKDSNLLSFARGCARSGPREIARDFTPLPRFRIAEMPQPLPHDRSGIERAM